MQELLPDAELIVKALLGFVVGALIGLERQKKMEGERTAGVRSFGLHSLLGAMVAYISQLTSNWIILVYGIAISLILVTGQVYYKLFRTMGKGLTTPLVFSLAFVLGTLVGFDTPIPGQLFGTLQIFSMTVAFLVFLVLGFKEELAHAVEVITREEMISAVELGVIILFIWPLIPETVTLGTIDFPAFQTYLLIVILLAVSFGNYLLVKKYKDRGIYFFGLFGGLANSEAAVSSVTDFYVNEGRRGAGRIALSINLANVAMVLRNGLLILLIDRTYLLFRLYVIPIAILIVASMLRLFQESSLDHKPEGKLFDTKLVSPFEFGPAIRFGVIFVGVYLVQLAFTQTFSGTGLIIAALIGGFVSAGAVIASSATVYILNPALYQEVSIAIIVATIVSVLNKMIYVYLADRETCLLRIVARDSLVIGSLILLYLVLFILGFV
ncbi:MAG: MgtC/SapB family protein [Candidatus Thorarchaeota archaeon]|nr:MgtC/SapB family protein [Candidatus Thorarchaeota archaeon]